MKIVHIDNDPGVAFLKLADGKTARITGADTEGWKAGDVILSNGSSLRKVPSEVWPSSTFTSVVREILDDGTVLGESGNAIIVLNNNKGLSIKVDDTVETDVNSIIIRIIANQPIRTRLHSDGEEVLPTSFLIHPDPDGLSFDDFGGYQDVVFRAKELIDTQLDQREILNEIGARPVKGILFTGPPGTGKTHLARIIANQSGASFYGISGPEIVSKWVGDTEGILREIFNHANNAKTGKAIIFFDEIDSIAENRSSDTHEASKRLVAQFLTLMDGFETKKAATIVIAATNRAEALDPALMRPGRFDWEIEFGLPTFSDRFQILTVGARRIACAEDLPLREIANRTHNWSAAQLSSIWTEAALIAARDRRSYIAGEDIAQAYERVARRPVRPQGGNKKNA